MVAKHSTTRTRSSRFPSRLIAGVATIVLAMVSFGTWALSSAVGSAADDDYHLSSIWCASYQGNTCDVDPAGEGILIPESLREGIYCYYHNPFQSAGCQPAMDGSDARPDVGFAHNNPVRNLYPNGFYNFFNLFKVPSIETTALNVRFINIGIFLGLGVLLFFTLPLRLRTPWIWMWVIGLVPMGMFVIPSSNPSSWAIMAVASGWIALLGYLETRGPRAWILLGVYIFAALLAVSARVDAVLYLGLVSLVAVWLSSTRGIDLVKKLWPGIIPLTGVVVALIINPANLSRIFGGLGRRSDYTDQPLPWTPSADVYDGTGVDWALLWSNFWNIPGLWLGIFGGSPWGALGWLDTPMPQIVLAGTLAVLVTIFIVAIRTADSQKLIAIGIMAIALWGMPLYLLQLGGFVAGEQVQPRYMLPLMMVLLGIMVLTPKGEPLLKKPGELWFVLGALSLANAIALHSNLRRYTTGIKVQGFNLDSPIEWWWRFLPDAIGPTALWAIGAVSFAVLLWLLLFRITRPGLESQSTPDPAPANQARVGNLV